MRGVEASVRIGDVEIIAVRDCEVRLRLERQFPEVDDAAFDPFRERWPEAFAPGVWIVPVRAFVLRGARWTVLFDAGLGTHAAIAGRFGASGALTDALARLDLAPERIETVALSHIHMDHVGGVTRVEHDGIAPAFARARHLLHPADLEVARKNASAWEAYGLTVLELDRRGLLGPVADGAPLNEAITVLHTPGHTPGSISLLVASRGAAALLCADAIPNPMLVTEPDWRYASDSDRDAAAATRKALLERVEREGLVLAPTHMPEPFGGLVRVAGKRHWRGR
jgi:glyoxylase-like metal-dependent hydrolase (beta-lactamase superfamily II)